jgi:hydrogenase maturation protein HypF
MSIPLITVQHHRAHGLACLGEHGKSRGLALVFDGAGLGEDGSLWGGECFFLDGTTTRRLASFDPVPLPGGDAAVLDPRRQLVGRCNAYGFPLGIDWMEALPISDKQWGMWDLQCQRGINTPMSHAAGRVFDSLAVLCGCLPDPISYEGQGAIRLESLALKNPSPAGESFCFKQREEGEILLIDWAPVFEKLLALSPPGCATPAVAYGLHLVIAKAALEMAEYAREQTGESVVALSGGVFQNGLLCSLVGSLLYSYQVPPTSDPASNTRTSSPCWRARCNIYIPANPAMLAMPKPPLPRRLQKTQSFNLQIIWLIIKHITKPSLSINDRRITISVRMSR